MRDYLRTHPGEVEDFNNFKKQIMRSSDSSLRNYEHKKLQREQDILEKAEEWSKNKSQEDIELLKKYHLTDEQDELNSHSNESENGEYHK